MNNLQGKKCIASYSGGKDSMLALYRAVNSGLLPLELMTTYNIDTARSWFHGMSENLVRNVSDSLSIPITLIKTTSELYEENFEKALANAKSRGAEVCVFGDIDIEGHFEWCSARCEKTGLMPYFPLWKEERKKLVYEFIDAGFLTIITVVDTKFLSEEFLGRIVSRKIADAIERSGADICGENGEFHTFTFGGPLFSRKIDFTVKDRIRRGTYCILHLEAHSECAHTGALPTEER